MLTWAVDLAQKHRAIDGTASVFGVIVYTDAHANTKKVLRDEDYWSALNEVSGPQWPVFSVRAQPGHYAMPRLPHGAVGLMIPIWQEPAANRELLAAFEIESTKDIPALVVFAVDNAGTLARTVVPFSDESQDSVVNALREVMRVVCSALAGVRPENLTDPEGAMAAVEYALNNYQDRKRIRNAYAVLRELRGWLPL